MNTTTTWIDAEVLNLYDTPAIHVRHFGPYGKTTLEITGKGVQALMGDSLAQLQDAKKLPSDARSKSLSERMAHEEGVTERLNTISREWASAHAVQYEIDSDKNPTGRVKVDGKDVAETRAHYSSDNE